MILTFSNFQDSHPSPKDATKTVPAKVKGNDGRDYTMSKAALTIVRENLGVSLEAEVTEKKNGTFTNYTVESARILATAPVSAPIAYLRSDPVSGRPEGPIQWTSTPSPTEAVVPHAAASPKPDIQMLIVRQSCLKAAVEFFGTYKAPTEDVLTVADAFVDWVFKAADVAQVLPVAQSPAAQHLEDARQKSHDRRADYSLEDAVCPGCGHREWLKQFGGGWFCAPSKTDGEPGGCGYPKRGERLDSPPSYGEWLQGQAVNGVPWK